MIITSRTERVIMIAALLGAAFLVGRYTQRAVDDVDGLYSSRAFHRATTSSAEEKKILARHFGDLIKSSGMKGLGKWQKKDTR